MPRIPESPTTGQFVSEPHSLEPDAALAPSRSGELHGWRRTGAILAALAVFSTGTAGCDALRFGSGPDTIPTVASPTATGGGEVHSASPDPVSSSTSPETAPSSSPSSLPSAFKIAQTMIVGFDAKTPKSEIEQVARATHFGGIYISDTTDAAADGFTPSFFAKLSQDTGGRLLVASDEEGGYIHRLRYGFNFPSAKTMGSLSVSEDEQIGEEAGRQMRADGVMWDLAPVLDLDNGKKDGAISKWDRSFGGSAANIADKAGAFAAGLQKSGVVPVFKHFPGIGWSTPDSNSDAHAAYSPPLAALEKSDMAPYRLLLGRGAVRVIMLSNEYVQGLDASRPASISPNVVRYLRDTLKFTGIITTDTLTALDGYDGRTAAQNITASARAGANVLLFGYTSTASIKRAIAEIQATVPPSQVDASYAMIRSAEGVSA